MIIRLVVCLLFFILNIKEFADRNSYDMTTYDQNDIFKKFGNFSVFHCAM